MRNPQKSDEEAFHILNFQFPSMRVGLISDARKARHLTNANVVIWLTCLIQSRLMVTSWWYQLGLKPRFSPIIGFTEGFWEQLELHCLASKVINLLLQHFWRVDWMRIECFLIGRACYVEVKERVRCVWCGGGEGSAHMLTRDAAPIAFRIWVDYHFWMLVVHFHCIAL